MSNSYYGYELYLKGEKCNDQGMKQYYFEKALKCCEKAISINPDMHLANFVSGSIYLDYKQDFKNAEFYLSKALELNPVHLETCINLGVTYNESKQYEKAVLAFEKAFIIDSLNETVTSNLALAYNNLAFNCPDKSKRPEYYEKALLNCQRAFQLKPESGIANFVAGSIYITYKNDLKGAVKFLERSISSNPKYTASYNLLGYAYFRSMQYNKAIKVFEKGLKVMPNEISFMKNLASIKEKTGNSQKAGE